MQVLKFLFNLFNSIRYQLLSIMAMCICFSCIFDQYSSINQDKLMQMWFNHQQLIFKILQYHYNIQGNIIYTNNEFKKKIYINFFWDQIDKNHYTIKLFNIFGFTIASVSVNNGVAYIIPDTIYQDYNIDYESQKWLINSLYILIDQLQQWIIGLPGDHTKYNLNNIGCLSNINYCYNDKNISIFYHFYYTECIPILPAIMEIRFDQYSIRFNINRWNL